MDTRQAERLIREQFRLEGEDVYRTSNGKRVVPSRSGYHTVYVGGLYVDYHRVKFCLANGWLPEKVDHKDRNTGNNLKENLRASTHQQNMQNTKDHNRELPRGVYRLPSGKYKAQVTEGGKNIHLGTFSSPEEAASVANDHRHRTHGNFYVEPKGD